MPWWLQKELDKLQQRQQQQIFHNNYHFYNKNHSHNHLLLLPQHLHLQDTTISASSSITTATTFITTTTTTTTITTTIKTPRISYCPGHLRNENIFFLNCFKDLSTAFSHTLNFIKISQEMLFTFLPAKYTREAHVPELLLAFFFSAKKRTLLPYFFIGEAAQNFKIFLTIFWRIFCHKFPSPCSELAAAALFDGKCNLGNSNITQIRRIKKLPHGNFMVILEHWCWPVRGRWCCW